MIFFCQNWPVIKLATLILLPSFRDIQPIENVRNQLVWTISRCNSVSTVPRHFAWYKIIPCPTLDHERSKGSQKMTHRFGRRKKYSKREPLYTPFPSTNHFKMARQTSDEMNNIHEAYVSIHEAYVSIHEAYVSIHEAYVSIHEAYVSIQYRKNLY